MYSRRTPASDAHPTQRTSVWTWPLLLNGLAVSGLVSALVADGAGDAWAWFALGVPVAVMAWFGLKRR